MYKMVLRRHTTQGPGLCTPVISTDCNSASIDKYNKLITWKRKFLATRKKNIIILFPLLSAVLMVTVTVFYLARKMYESSYTEEDLRHLYTSVGYLDTRPPKIVLFYNAPPHLGWTQRFFRECDVSNCIYTTDSKFLHASSAVFFYHETLPILPVSKRNGIWIFLTSETIQRTLPTYMLPWWQGKFNWTMSYRKSSELFFGYGKVVRRKSPPKRDYEKIYSEKNRKVAFLVSHCNTMSRREDYVAEMKKYIKVDVIGSCGDKAVCEKYFGNENDTCRWMISKQYMFLLSFENSLCRDYITEKFFSVYNNDMPIIPVVRGAYNMKQLVPAEAYIDTADFASPRHLAEYLNDIISDKHKYIELLRTKDSYSSISSEMFVKESFCELCARVNDDKSVSKTTDIYEWLRYDHCLTPTDC